MSHKPPIRARVLVMLVCLLLVAAALTWAQEPEPPADEPSPGAYDFDTLLAERGLVWGLLIAFATGILVSFTPCVYPMIPITVGIIAGREEKPSLARSLGLSFVYVLGLALVYAALGVAVALIGAQLRSLLMSPYVLGAVALFFVALALSMFGLYEIQVPPRLATRLQSVGGAGVVGVFLMGMVSGIVASPCTAAPLAGILTFVAVSGDAVRGFLLLLAFALGMGLLLIVVGASAGALKSLPRSGQWMVDVKRLFGFLFLAVALYFVRTLIPDLAYFLATAACIVGGGIALGALDGLPESPGAGLRLKKGLALVIMVLGFYVLIGTLWGAGLFLPHGAGVRPDQATATAAPEVVWETDIDTAFERALDEDRLVLIDFRADWCPACVEMEEQAFPRPDIAAALQRFVLLRVDVTDLSKEEEELTEKYALPGYPTIVVANKRGRKVDMLSGYEGPDWLVAFLESQETR